MKEIFTNINKKKLIKVLVFLLVTSLYCSFLVTKIALPGSLDLPRQIQNGKDILHGNFDVLTQNVYSYTEPSQPFANHHWFYGVIAYIMQSAIGWLGISIFKIFFMVLTFWLLFYLVLKKSDFWVAILFSIPTIFIFISRTAFRPELFSYFFLVLFLYLLFDLYENPNKNRVFWLVSTMLVWVNTHLFFPIGILLVAGLVFERLILHFKAIRSDIIIKKLATLLVLLIVTMFLNPYGLLGVVKSLRVNTAPDFPIHSMEVSNIFSAFKMDPSFSNFSITVYIYAVIFLLLCFITTFIIRYKTKRPLFSDHTIFLFLASVGSAGLSYFIFRALPLFASIFFISSTYLCKDLLDKPRLWIGNQTKQIQKISFNVLVGVFVIFICFLMYVGQNKMMQYQEQGFGLAKESLASAEFFKDQGLLGPLFNDTDSGSYLIGELYPHEKVFTDNRFGDAYSASFFKDIYLPMTQNETAWYQGLDKYKFNTIFIYNYDMGDGIRNFVFNRIYDPEWVWVYVDKYNIILVRNNLENKDIIDKFKITPESAPEKLSYLIESDYARDKLNAADVLNLVGRTDVSIPLYLQYLSLKPGNGEIWFVLGRTELTKANQIDSNPSLAAVYLERAIDNGWKTWQSYSYLALAYYRTNQFERMKDAVNKELKITPDSQDAKDWIDVIKKMNEKDNANK